MTVASVMGCFRGNCGWRVVGQCGSGRLPFVAVMKPADLRQEFATHTSVASLRRAEHVVRTNRRELMRCSPLERLTKQLGSSAVLRPQRSARTEYSVRMDLSGPYW